jgi:hypothetical protein
MLDCIKICWQVRDLMDRKRNLIHSIMTKILLEKKADLFLALELLQNMAGQDAADFLESYITK